MKISVVLSEVWKKSAIITTIHKEYIYKANEP